MTASDPAGQLVGAVLNGRWRLVRLLGEGGMGAVYEADGIRGEGKRAVKLLHEEFIQVDEVLQRFWAEAQASRSLNHPNIAHILEAATAENGTPYLVMELLQGIPLANWTDRRQAIPADIAVPVMHGVLEALQVAHARGIIHRDLKPDNLFLLPDGQGGYQPKVLDFGIAKIMDAAGGMGQKTRTGVLLGTPGYMSPEQIRNAKGVDARSDLWSIGIIFYEMLTGVDAFPAENEFARLTAVLTNELQPIEKVAPSLAKWAPFFARALAKDPAQRYQTADEMAQALVSTHRGQSFGATPPQSVAAYAPAPATMGGPPRAGAPVAPTLGSNTPAGPTAGAGPSGHTHMSAQQPPGTPAYVEHTPSIHVVAPAPQAKGAPWWLVAVVGVVCLGGGFALGYLLSPSGSDGTTPAAAKPATPTAPAVPTGTKK